MRLLLENVSGLLVLVGFVALEAGIAVHWSGPLAAIVGGPILMAVGAVPYVRRMRPR